MMASGESGDMFSVFLDIEHEHSLPTASQVLSSFENAESPAAWLNDEIAAYLFPDADLDERAPLLAEHLLSADAQLEKFASAQLLPEELVVFEIRIEGERTTIGLFKELPTPTTLMQLCCAQARVGDEIKVRHITASLSDVSLHTRWPFPYSVAVALCSPDPGALARPVSSRRLRLSRRSS